MPQRGFPGFIGQSTLGKQVAQSAGTSGKSDLRAAQLDRKFTQPTEQSRFYLFR
jgi:hypothetical protein